MTSDEELYRRRDEQRLRNLGVAGKKDSIGSAISSAISGIAAAKTDAMDSRRLDRDRQAARRADVRARVDEHLDQHLGAPVGRPVAQATGREHPGTAQRGSPGGFSGGGLSNPQPAHVYRQYRRPEER